MNQYFIIIFIGLAPTNQFIYLIIYLLNLLNYIASSQSKSICTRNVMPKGLLWSNGVLDQSLAHSRVLPSLVSSKQYISSSSKPIILVSQATWSSSRSILFSSGIIFQGNSTMYRPSWDLLCQDSQKQIHLSVMKRLVLV